MMIAVAGVAVALVCFILYALDRKSKSKPIVWGTAGKISVLGGLLTSGVTYAMTPDVTTVVEVVKEAAPEVAQDMFVGKPTF